MFRGTCCWFQPSKRPTGWSEGAQLQRSQAEEERKTISYIKRTIWKSHVATNRHGDVVTATGGQLKRLLWA